MALIPSAAYPGRVATDLNWPQGKARNVVVVGDGTGTPLEQKWVNDLWGFQQALLAAAAITPTGTPDQVGASQYLQAIQALIVAQQNVFAAALAAGFTTGPLNAGHIEGSSADFAGAVSTGNINCINLIASGNLGTTGAVLATGGINAGGGFTADAPSTLRLRKRHVIGANAATSYGPKDWDHVVVPTGVLSSGWNYTIDDTDAENDETLTFTNHDMTHLITVLNPAATLGIGSVYRGQSITFARIAGTWTLTNQSIAIDT